MDRSKLSNIFATTRLLPFFSSQNVNRIKCCIFEQLGCENESQFLCKVLQSLYKNMSVQSSAVIKNKAIKIAELQQMTQTQNDSIANAMINAKCNDNHITVYKHMQQQYNDPLSGLHSDIIDYLGTFLNKKESIEFGYLNKQLFIETQKQSYLLKRCNDDAFIFTDTKISRLLQSQSNAFNYSFPNHLTLLLDNSSFISKISNFNSFFRGLNTLQCNTFASLSHIPCDVLFNGNMNRDDKLQRLGLILGFFADPNGQIDAINKFCTKFDEYKDSTDMDNNNKLRCIKKFDLDAGHLWLMRPGETKTAAQHATKQLLIRLCNISESVSLSTGVLVINTIEDLQTIFHARLKHLYLSSRSTIELDKSLNNDSINNKNLQEIAKVESVGIHLNDNGIVGTSNACTIKSFGFLDLFSMRSGIKCYTIHWECSSSINYFHSDDDDVMNVFGSKLDILDKIFFQDYDKHSLLEKILIKFEDECDLTVFARLLMYFNQHYNKLFVERKLYLKNFKCIEIEFDGIIRQFFGDSMISEYKCTDNGVPNDKEMIFFQQSDKEYPIYQNTIEIKNIKQGIESFGIVYKNVFNWLKSRQQESSSHEINGCKIKLLC